jgi:hypothetical protein
MGASLQEIFESGFERYAKTHRLPLHAHKAAQAIRRCRTAALGAHVQRCPAGHFERLQYHSCRHRSCPKCAARVGRNSETYCADVAIRRVAWAAPPRGSERNSRSSKEPIVKLSMLVATGTNAPPP